MSKYAKLETLKTMLVENWNTDPAGLTPMELGDNSFQSYYKNSLEMMMTEEILDDWISYFERKQIRRANGEEI